MSGPVSRSGPTGRWARRMGLVWCVAALGAMWVPVVSAQRAPKRAAVSAANAAPRDTASAASPIRLGTMVRPDTVLVGDPFTLTVTIEAPVGTTVQWPTIGDTAAVVVMRAPTRVTSEDRDGMRRETAEYALTAWDVGTLPLGLPEATVRTPDGVRAVPLRSARIVVMSVLPADTSLHVPKPARALFPRVVPWWEAWWPAAVAVVALMLLWGAWYRRRHRVVNRVVAPLDVFARAMHDFDRLQRLALADLGERGRAVALGVEILRTYLSARFPAAVLSETSTELLTAIGADARVPRDRLTSLLAEVDAIKFAHDAVSAPRARELHDEARAVVSAIEQAEQARRKREESARLAAERADRDTERVVRRNAEDEARRRARRPKAGAT
ncbi:MAG: hypothetical protein IPP90_16505 [Gemmatimonadaceae bacterium]|nr:hypothetical protein [Gemmatimonadaceae bacterium]